MMLAEIYERRVLDGRVLNPGDLVHLPAADVDRLGETGAAQAAIRLITVDCTIPLLTHARKQIGAAHATYKIIQEQGMSGTRTIPCTRTLEVDGRQYQVDIGVPLELDRAGPAHYTITLSHPGVVIGETVAAEHEVTSRDEAGRMQTTLTRRYHPPTNVRVV